jgi:hypothetical protein
MAVPRPILLAVLGLFLVSATFLATRNSHEQSSGSSKPAAQPATAEPTQSAKAGHAAKPAPKQATASARKPQTSRRTRPARRPSALSKPAAVARAIGNGRVVVLAFFQPGADDRADQAAVADVKRRHLASVYTDRIGNIGRYRPVVGALGIQQAPAIVIVDSKRRAHLIEGYVDPETLAQEVADLRS